MGNCANCSGCSNCGGCGASLTLTEAEISLLRLFSQIPFLPVARHSGSEEPVFLELGAPDFYGVVIACLERKGLIDIDYHMPLGGFDYATYAAYPLKGSMALTARGQETLDLLERQGFTEASDS